MRFAVLLVLAMGACATPGVEVIRQSTDFALLEVKLKG